MENPKLTPELAERIINLLRDNPGVEMTITDIANMAGLATEDAAAYLENLADRGLLLQTTTDDGFDLYTFPNNLERGTA